ncbi:hypothetical protein [Winogradskyella sp. MIT101101]|uniref:hypothetical protein n=1 Tax=Winogradskyella sp. MIT101101 TaxID=3098297 RepID=UPI00399B90E7
MKKTITIKKDIPKSIIIGLLSSIILVFVIEHFGDFSYVANVENTYTGGKINLVDYVSPKTPLENIYLDTPFGSRFTFDGNNFTIGDMKFVGGDFKPYTNRISYYFKATFMDFKYVLLVSLILTVIVYLSKNFKLKFN